MSTYRFPLRGKIGSLSLNWEMISRLIGARRKSIELPAGDALQDVRPLTEEEVRNLPVAHRYSA
jgi:hypothetical protein